VGSKTSKSVKDLQSVQRKYAGSAVVPLQTVQPFANINVALSEELRIIGCRDVDTDHSMAGHFMLQKVEEFSWRIG
jgi:hypothetical protein